MFCVHPTIEFTEGWRFQILLFQLDTPKNNVNDCVATFHNSRVIALSSKYTCNAGHFSGIKVCGGPGRKSKVAKRKYHKESRIKIFNMYAQFMRCR